MHKNHRRGFVAPLVHGSGWYGPVKRAVKTESREVRRSHTRKVLYNILQGILDPDAAIYMDPNAACSDRWAYD